MKRVFCMGWALLVLLAAPALQAQEALKPVVLAVFPSYDELMADVDYLGGLSGQPQASQQIEQMLALFTQGQGLAGLDKSKPCGVAMFLDGGQPVGLLFVPVTDLKKLLRMVEPFTGLPEESQDHEGLLELSVNGQSVYIKERNGWAWFSNSPDLLGKVPKDPQGWIDPLAKRYDLAVQVRVQNIPEASRQMLLQAIREGAAAGLAEAEENDPRLRKVQQEVLRAQLKQLEDLLSSLDRLTFGFRVDRKAKNLVFAGEATFLPESVYGRLFKDYRALPTRLAVFSPPGAILRFHSAAAFGEAARRYAREQIKQAQKVFEQLFGNLPQEEPQARQAKAFAQGYLRFLNRIIEAESLDVALAVENRKGHVFFSAAVQAPGGPDFRQVVSRGLERLARHAEESEKARFRVRLNVARQGEVTYHQVVPAKLNELQKERVEKALGPQPSLTIGASQSALYLAVGSKSLEQLRQQVASAQTGTPQKLEHFGYCEFGLRPLLELLQEFFPDHPVIAQVAQSLPQNTGDKVRLVMDLVPNGERVELIVEEGVLRAVLGMVRTLAQDRAQEAVPEF